MKSNKTETKTFNVAIGVAGYEGDAHTWYTEYVEVKFPADKVFESDGDMYKYLFETAKEAFMAETDEVVAGVFNEYAEEIFEDEDEFDCE